MPLNGVRRFVESVKKCQVVNCAEVFSVDVDFGNIANGCVVEPEFSATRIGVGGCRVKFIEQTGIVSVVALTTLRTLRTLVALKPLVSLRALDRSDVDPFVAIPTVPIAVGFHDVQIAWIVSGWRQIAYGRNAA